jgi:hypothetical protein
MTEVSVEGAGTLFYKEVLRFWRSPSRRWPRRC